VIESSLPPFKERSRSTRPVEMKSKLLQSDSFDEGELEYLPLLNNLGSQQLEVMASDEAAPPKGSGSYLPF
jgi:hypothetical protein